MHKQSLASTSTGPMCAPCVICGRQPNSTLVAVCPDPPLRKGLSFALSVPLAHAHSTSTGDPKSGTRPTRPHSPPTPLAPTPLVPTHPCSSPLAADPLPCAGDKNDQAQRLFTSGVNFLESRQQKQYTHSDIWGAIVAALGNGVDVNAGI